MDIPYWLDEDLEPLPQRSPDGPADVVVVGGGITGCSCALTLAGEGMRVRLHEARAVASGASGRNGGFALRGGAMAYHRAREWLGAERARDYWRWTESYLDRMEALGGDAFRRLGSLRLAAQEELEELRDEFEALHDDGFDAEWTDGLHPRLEGRFTAAIVHPRDGVLHPARFVHGLARAAAEAGVEIHEHSRVESLEELDAGTVVVATDGYPSGLLGELEGLIVPTRAQMLATEPLPELLYERPHYGRQGFDYWHQRPDGSLLVGGFRDISLESEFTDDERTTEPIQTELERFAEDLAGGRPRITHRWAGIFGLVLDFLPVVGRIPGKDGVWVAGGYSGHGNVLGLACGELVAEAILGRPGWQLELFDPARLVFA